MKKEIRCKKIISQNIKDVKCCGRGPICIYPFNVNWDGNAKYFSSIFHSSSLTQHVQERTQRYGYILDMVISVEEDTCFKEVSVTSMLSDHFLVNIEVSFKKLPVSYHKYKSIDKDVFLADL